jgi:Flp pilus assembly protein TadB
MNAVVIALFGAGVGAGLLIIVRAFQPRPVTLEASHAALDRTGVSVAALADPHDDTPGVTGLRRLFSVGGLHLMRIAGVADRPRLLDQLRVLDKPLERHAYEKLLAATAGFGFVTLTGAALGIVGTAVSPLVVGVAATVMAIGGFFYPDLPLADQVTARRAAFKHAFSAYLDLVTILLAGGAGIESALQGAADAGDGWAFGEIRRALRRARLTRRTPWDAFDQLGTELGVNELNELAASVSLAGDHGARIKDSLTARADALRSSQAAELEADAEARTERMIVPVVVMILGLVLFIAFGAVDAITDSSGSQFAPTPTAIEGG